MQEITLHDLEFIEILSEKHLLESIKSLGLKIREEYYDKYPLVLVILNGAFVFAAELIKYFDFPLELDFVRYRSYKGLHSSGEIQKSLPFPGQIEGRHVLLLEDIVDTGLTLSVLTKDLLDQHPESLKTACLLYKPEALIYPIEPDFYSFQVENKFLVGFGLDYKGLGRNLRNLYQLKPGKKP